MTRTFQSSDDVGGGGNAIEKPGTYHCSIRDAADGTSTKGNPITGVSAILTVLDGTNADQKDREFHLHLFDPDMSKSQEAQEWAKKKQTAYAIAINQLDPSKLGQQVEIDFAGGAEGQQIVIALESNEYQGKTRLDLAYANIYHVDDPRAARFPKNKDALALIDKSNRRDADWFKPLSNRNGVATATAGAGLSDAELDSI